MEGCTASSWRYESTVSTEPVNTEPDLAEEAAVDVVRVEEVPACAEQATAAVHKEEFLVIGTAVEPFPAVESITAAKAGVGELKKWMVGSTPL